MESKQMTNRILFALAGLALSASAGGACLPPSLNQIAAGSNPRGDWVGWWCPSGRPYVAACLKSTCSLVGSKRAVAAWVSNPSEPPLTFGRDPHQDAELRAVWEPERAKLDALKP
jgi:hypothetical protein